MSKSKHKLSLLAASAFLALAVNAAAAVTFETWPTTTSVVTADNAGQFGEDLSGLFYQPATGGRAPVLWAVKNSPSILYKLGWNGSIYANATDNNWSKGKKLKLPNGKGAPDSEGVTMAELDSSAVYVSIERNSSGANRFSVLRYDTSAPGSSLVATNEWNVTSVLPKVSETNLGLEGVAWIPDSYLVGKGFVDSNTKLPYDPANYPNHGSGLFLVGLEYNGQIYAFALNQKGSTYNLIASFSSGQKHVVDLSFDRDNGTLWSYCDDNCSNHATLLGVDTGVGSATKGQFVVKKGYNPPSGISASENNEGIAIAPESECVNGLKTFIWTDDGASKQHALRRGTISCGPQF